MLMGRYYYPMHVCAARSRVLALVLSLSKILASVCLTIESIIRRTALLEVAFLAVKVFQK